VAAQELISCGRKVALIDQENEANLGGQAFWSLGGLFLVNSPEQRRWGVKHSFELAWNDWLGSAQFDRVDDEDLWAMRWRIPTSSSPRARSRHPCLARPLVDVV
jgi:uncharacterized protein